MSTEYISGSTATNEKTIKVPLANIELTANHEEQQKASGRLYSLIIWVLVRQCTVNLKCLYQLNLVNLEFCDKELCV